MVIKDDEFHINDTYRYLYPILRMYGNDYIQKIKNLYKQGVFIDDFKSERDYDEYLHLVINTEKTIELFGNVIDDSIAWLKSHGMLKKSYALDNDCSKLVLMLRLPDKYQGCIIDKFINGNVNMFERMDVIKYFQAQCPQNIPYFKYCRDVMTLGKKVQIDIDKEVLNL